MKKLNLAVNPALKADKPMRNILGMNNLPQIVAKSRYGIQKEWFDALNLKHIRHHDAAQDNPGQQLLDVSRIFPLFHADENDPANYIFHQSDDYMQSLVGMDVEIDYRLGECIDHSCNGRLVQMPKDPEKWARICRNIIAHFKTGAMNGMHLNITRVTVWEEPDNNRLFGGTLEDYCKLYCAVYREFKKYFPEILVGGPTVIGGNFAYIEGFLDYCKAEGIQPDCVTATYYVGDPDRMPAAVARIQSMLDARGFSDTGITITEWHMAPLGWDDYRPKMKEYAFDSSKSAALSASAMMRLMDVEELDVAYYYAWSHNAWATYNEQVQDMTRLPVYFGLKFFNELAADCNERLAVEWEGSEDIHVLAGRTEEGKVRLLVSCFDSARTEFACKVEGAVSCRMKSVCSSYAEVDAVEGEELELKDGVVTFKQARAGSDVYLLEFDMES